MTKYEFAEIVAMRAALLYDGATPLVDEKYLSHRERDDVIAIAESELLNGKLRFQLHRTGADGVHRDVIDSSDVFVDPSYALSSWATTAGRGDAVSDDPISSSIGRRNDSVVVGHKRKCCAS